MFTPSEEKVDRLLGIVDYLKRRIKLNEKRVDQMENGYEDIPPYFHQWLSPEGEREDSKRCEVLIDKILAHAQLC